jgi:Protein kinase domain
MPAPDSLPRKIGPYRLLDKLGEGGMGVVYLGADSEKRRVAIKVLGPAVAGDPSARQRLAREVETMRRVRSPHVAEVVDADVDGPSPFIVTRYVPGLTLEETVRRQGPLRGTDLDRLASGLADALAAIHAARVVHRDLKPGNVMLEGGEPVVIDFGIAHVPDATRLTKTGLVMGTPGFLAPEVIEGAASSGASDVHSWGGTLAFAATGHQPFGTGTYQTVFFRVLEGKAELDGIPPRLLPFVTAALSVDPRARPTARWLAQQLAMPVNGARMTAAGVAATRVEYPSTRVLPPKPVTTHPAVGAPWPARVEYRSPAQAARDVADLLPPVAYPPPGEAAPWQRAEPRVSQGAVPSQARAAAAPQAPVSGHGVVLFALGAAAIALAVLLPVAGTVLVLAALALLRAVDTAQAALAGRRSLYGARLTDILVMIAAAPWTVVRAVVKTALLVPLALPLAVPAAVAAVVFDRAGTLPAAGSWAAGAAVLCYCFGPGSGTPKRQLRRMSAALFRTRSAMAVGWISSLCLASAFVSLAISEPPLIWPATSSTIPHLMPGLPSLGGTLHSVQGWLLRNTVGMLHLP